MLRALSMRFAGYIGSLILTFIAYFIIVKSEFFGFSLRTAVIIIFGFALVQSIIQLIFFINVWQEKGWLWNLGIFLSTVFIIFVIVFFSIWIIDHLNYNMMP